MSSNQESSSSKQQSVTLRSSDDRLFEVPTSEAELSGSIKNLIEDNCSSDVIPLPNVEGKVLEKVIMFMQNHADESLSESDKKKFNKDILSGMDMNEKFDIILAANYLEFKPLLDETAQNIADLIKDKSVEFVRKTFKIVNDFTPEEEKQIKEQYAWAWEGIKD